MHSIDRYGGTELGFSETATNKTKSLYSDWGDKQTNKIITDRDDARKEIECYEENGWCLL